MNQFFDAVVKSNPLLKQLVELYKFCPANFYSDGMGIMLNRQENPLMEFKERMMFKDDVMTAAQAQVTCSILMDTKTNYIRVSDNLTRYITQLNGFECVLKDVIPPGRMIIRLRHDSKEVFLFLANEHNTIFLMPMAGNDERYSIHHAYVSDSVYKSTEDDVYKEDGEEFFHSMSFVIKLFKLMKDKIPVSEQIEKIPRFKTGNHKLTRDVRYISLSETGIARAKKVEDAIKIIRADPKYGVAVWWRRPHYRGETYIDGVWCHRKAGEVTDKRETVYTM